MLVAHTIMTLEQLRIFVAVAEREHLTQAADGLALSPSAVSAAIRALEGRYGASLFDRVGRRIVLSETGRLFLPEARATLKAAASAELALSEIAGLKRGSLMVQASQTVAAYWLPPLLVAFHRQYPGIDLTLAIGNTATVARAVRDGVADLGFIEGQIEEPLLASRMVAVDRLILLAAPGHDWVEGRPPVAADLLAGRWILREEGSGTRSAFEASLKADGIDTGALEVAMSLPSNEAVLTALGSGAFVGVASERAAATALLAGRLKAIDYVLRPRAFSMLWHRERHPSRAARAFEGLLPTAMG